MKKIVIVIFLLVLSMSVYAQSGIIRELSGTVELLNPGAADFVAARNGDRVNEDTVISTGFRSTALVEVGITLITVRPLTRLSLTEIRAGQGAETINVAMQAGRVRVDVTPPAGTRASMQIASPSATASVRGTSFYFDTRNINVTEGIVFFKGSRGHTAQLHAGSSGFVGRNNTVSPARGTAAIRPSSPVGHDGTSKPTGALAPEAKSNGNGQEPGGPGWPGEPGDPGSPGDPGGGGIGVEY